MEESSPVAEIDAPTNNIDEKPNDLRVPKPVYTGNSPCSSPYFKKLPPLSPRSMKLIDPNYSLADFTFPRDSTCSNDSNFSSYDSGYSTSLGDGAAGFESVRKTSTSSNTDQDINFFLKVVGAFREYTADQIASLEDHIRENQVQLEPLQRELKKIENTSSLQEVQLSRDFAHLVSVLHRRQAELGEVTKKRNRDAADSIREQIEQCRRNIKLISGVVNFSKRLHTQSEESLRENAVREFKHRLAIASELQIPNLPLINMEESRIDINLAEQLLGKIGFATEAEEDACVPVILAAHPDDDITRNSVAVRWHFPYRKTCTFEIKWWYSKGDEKQEKAADGITSKQYVITGLPSNRKISVTVRSSYMKAEWCEPVCFRTLQAPAKFRFDVNTAHAKLQLSPDANTVFYPGEEKCSSSPKSPSRFTFALNVLGNVSFYCGRHYWEIAVNRDGWAVGVASSNIPRNCWLGSSETSWILHYNASKYEYKVRSGGEALVVKPILNDHRSYVKRVGIYLDYEGGMISFIDCQASHILHTYSVESFNESVCAAVNPFYHGGELTLYTGLEVPKFLY